jgi:hypothetical protein
MTHHGRLPGKQAYILRDPAIVLGKLVVKSGEWCALAVEPVEDFKKIFA